MSHLSRVIKPTATGVLIETAQQKPGHASLATTIVDAAAGKRSQMTAGAGFWETRTAAGEGAE